MRHGLQNEEWHTTVGRDAKLGEGWDWFAFQISVWFGLHEMKLIVGDKCLGIVEDANENTFIAGEHYKYIFPK